MKKTEERLSRNLSIFSNLKTISDNYNKYIKSLLNSTPIYYVDETDLAKPNVKAFECLGDVQDGSKEHKWTKGYGITEIVTLINDEPIITQSCLWSTADDSFKSKNIYLYDLLNKNHEYFGLSGIYVFDRGFDQTNLMQFLIKNNDKFIIRIKGSRKFQIGNKELSLDEVLNKYKGKILLNSQDQKKVYYNKLSYVKCHLRGIKEELTLVLSFSEFSEEEPALFITNLEVKNAHDVRFIVRTYHKRWRIEEFFKFKKTQFNLEDIRVRSLNALRVMNSLINYVITFISLTRKQKWLFNKIIKISKPIKETIYFNYYRLSMGITEILNNVIFKTCDYINSCIRDLKSILKSKKEQRNLFNFNIL